MATSYNPYYSGGWQSGEEGNTPITPDALNHMDTGIADAFNYTTQSTALHKITDCDNAPMGDSYVQSSDTAHTPTNSGNYFVHSFNIPTEQHNAQIAIKRNSTYVDTYVRNKSGGTWGEWRQVSVIR